MVHNAFLSQHVQKSVTEIPFRPSPRAITKGEWTMSPKPVFFVTNKTAETTVRRLVKFLVDGTPRKPPGIFASALRG